MTSYRKIFRETSGDVLTLLKREEPFHATDWPCSNPHATMDNLTNLAVPLIIETIARHGVTAIPEEAIVAQRVDTVPLEPVIVTAEPNSLGTTRANE